MTLLPWRQKHPAPSPRRSIEVDREILTLLAMRDWPKGMHPDPMEPNSWETKNLELGYGDDKRSYSKWRNLNTTVTCKLKNWESGILRQWYLLAPLASWAMALTCPIHCLANVLLKICWWWKHSLVFLIWLESLGFPGRLRLTSILIRLTETGCDFDQCLLSPD